MTSRQERASSPPSSESTRSAFGTFFAANACIQEMKRAAITHCSDSLPAFAAATQPGCLGSFSQCEPFWRWDPLRSTRRRLGQLQMTTTCGLSSCWNKDTISRSSYFTCKSPRPKQKDNPRKTAVINHSWANNTTPRIQKAAIPNRRTPGQFRNPGQSLTGNKRNNVFKQQGEMPMHPNANG